MDIKEKLEKAKKAIFKQAEDVKGIEIKGHDFNKDFSLKEFIESYKSIGFQASELYKAIEIIREMRKNKAKIYLAYTSGNNTSGNRDIIRYLVENKFVDVLITTTAGIEEDIIKCIKPFILGKFNADGKELRKNGINRTGNIFVPNDRYCLFEEWTNPILKELLEEQKNGKTITASYISKKFGEKINDESSICYQAQKNNIPMFIPAPLDGSLGDMVYFFKQSNKEFEVDVTQDLMDLIDYTLQAEKTGMIILGAGTVKHTVCNTNLFRDGADYAVYINTAQEFDGSDSGATPDEAVSWGKIKDKQNTVKVFADATIVFPIIVAGAFLD
ncbi:MAG: deoxyhypusine synthase [Nanoarchaeota archaeon]|mgnify:CR=1 FL=1